MKKLIPLFLIILFSASYCYSQDYLTAVGLRGGVFSGVSVKQKLSDEHMLEIILSAREGGFNITMLAEKQRVAFENEHWHWYYGMGAHIGSWPRAIFRYPWNNDLPPDGSRFVVGMDAIGGLEYTFDQVPINLSLDFKPSLNFIPLGVFAEGLALTVRYTFR